MWDTDRDRLSRRNISVTLRQKVCTVALRVPMKNVKVLEDRVHTG
jgi:hypothetical protein